jgi:hypothetical protein
VRYSLVLILLTSLRCWTQTTTTGEARTGGPCSVANTGSDNKIQISCGIGKEQGQQMLAILNKILTDHLDTNAVMTKLDEIQSGVSSIKSELDNNEKQKEEAERKRRTAPILFPSLVPIAAGKVNMCIKSGNQIPYEFDYFITDSKHLILGGFPMYPERVFPPSDAPLYCIPKDIDLASIPDHYIELSFDFQSLSYDELHLPGHAGRITKKYRISPDGKSISLIP